MDEKIKLYSQRAIAIATYFGGPLAAGILIRKNSLNLGREKEGLIALIVGIVSTILLFYGILQIPEPILDKIPNVLIPAVYTGIIYLIVEKTHGQILKKHKEENKEFYSNWRATGIGLICTVVLAGGIIAYVYNAPVDWDVDTYNAELKKLENNESEAMKLFDMLEYSPKHEIIYFIEKTGIPKWEENIDILNRISGIENIPEEIQKQNKLLLEYSKLRIEAYKLITKAIIYETSEYDEEINKRHTRIDEIIKKL
ncbi:MAG: hypothetical protein GX102_12950 [Porphyromonadaceae bacterium]|jgi:hypothetical protein|nr:hypothetical protein [Porphyromonadaceae bacterium]